MVKKIRLLNTGISAVMLSMVIAACVWTQAEKEARTQRLLKNAGFKMRPADTPEKLAQVKQLPQRKFVSHQQGVEVLYIYADADHCKCVYTGDEEAYRRYQTVAADKKAAKADGIMEDRNKPARIDWGEWRFDENW
jgi:hypothetical protein